MRRSDWMKAEVKENRELILFVELFRRVDEKTNLERNNFLLEKKYDTNRQRNLSFFKILSPFSYIFWLNFFKAPKPLFTH